MRRQTAALGPDSAGSQLSAIAATDSAAAPSDARDCPINGRSAQPPTRDRWQRLRVDVIALPRQVDLSTAAGSERTISRANTFEFDRRSPKTAGALISCPGARSGQAALVKIDQTRWRRLPNRLTISRSDLMPTRDRAVSRQ
jgi:hypothetical protein